MRNTSMIVVTIMVALLPFNNNQLKARNMENNLNPEQQKIVTIAAHTATGNLDALRTELNAGLDAGLTINRIKEVLVQM